MLPAAFSVSKRNEFCIKTLVSRHTKFNLFRSWGQLTIQCVYASLQKMPFRWSSFWSWRICKQAKLSHLGHRKPADIFEKPAHPKRVSVWCGFWSRLIYIYINNWTIFPRKWARRSRYSKWRLLSGHVERIFVHKNWRGGYWQHLVSTGRCYVLHNRSYTRCLAPCFWRSHYQPQS